MEHTTLVCPSQSWNGPKGSTFSPIWNDSLNSYMLAPCPDVIKPSPPCQLAAGTYHSAGVSPLTPKVTGPPVTALTAPTSAATKRGERECGTASTVQKERRSRSASGVELHRRSLSLSTAVTSNPAVTRRRCESYALSYPSSSSEDSGSDSTLRRGDCLPDAVPRARSRSIILRKLKRRPAPPVRTVSLKKLTDVELRDERDRRTQSLYIPRDDLHNTLLPDLIPVPKSEVDGHELSFPAGAMPAKAQAKQSLPSHRPLNELRSSEPCRLQLSSGPATTETVKVPGSMDSNNSPSSSRSSSSQPSVTSPSKPPGSTSPSSGYSSQCETPTLPVMTSVITGQSPLGCRMRPKPSTSTPGQGVRACRSQLFLQLPETRYTPPEPDPAPAEPRVSRRHSDTSATTRPKQRRSTSMLIMPVVTQEDLNNVRLRSVSSSEPDNGQEGNANFIEEETERDGCPPALQSPKAKPPVAPKPPMAKRSPNPTAQPPSVSPHAPEYMPASFNDGQGNTHTMLNKAKPKTTQSPPAANSNQVQKQVFDGQQPMRNLSRPQSSCHSEVQDPNRTTFSRTTQPCPSDLDKKRKTGPPPVPRKPEGHLLPSGQESTVGHARSPPRNFPKSASTPQDRHHIWTNGGMSSDWHANGKGAPEYSPYDKAKERSPIPDMSALSFTREEDEVFVQKPMSHTTEDLFTIIHRSKRRLLGRKEPTDSTESRQSDFGTQILGGVPKSSSQNDSFMALLRRTRSAKAGSGGRISATELLRSSKPTTEH